MNEKSIHSTTVAASRPNDGPGRLAGLHRGRCVSGPARAGQPVSIEGGLVGDPADPMAPLMGNWIAIVIIYRDSVTQYEPTVPVGREAP